MTDSRDSERATSRGGDVPRGAPAPFEVADGAHEVFAGVPDSAAEFEPGHAVAGQFEVVRRLGSGRMGIVYEVNDRVTRERLALKAIVPSVLAEPAALARFVTEINEARHLHHPGIVAVYDVRQAGPVLFYTMEYVEGETLRQILDKHNTLSLGKATGLLHRVCRALEHAHESTMHGGICPENVMVMPDATVRLLDFGIAKTINLQSPSCPETAKARRYYMAPEQRQDPGSADARADMFSLGVLFFEMLSGELPRGYNWLSELRPDVPKECDQVLAYAVRSKKKRCQTAHKFRKAVEWCYSCQRKGGGQTPVEQESGRLPLVHSELEREWEEWERHAEQLALEASLKEPTGFGEGGGLPGIGRTLRKWLGMEE